MFITFCKTRGKKKKVVHSLALALTLTLNHLANEPLQATTMLYGLMYLTYDGMEHKYLLKCTTDYK